MKARRSGRGDASGGGLGVTGGVTKSMTGGGVLGGGGSGRDLCKGGDGEADANLEALSMDMEGRNTEAQELAGEGVLEG